MHSVRDLESVLSYQSSRRAKAGQHRKKLSYHKNKKKSCDSIAWINNKQNFRCGVSASGNEKLKSTLPAKLSIQHAASWPGINTGEIWEKLKLSLERKKKLFYPFAHQRHANQLHKFDRGILESNSIADFGFIKENRIESGDFAFWK